MLVAFAAFVVAGCGSNNDDKSSSSSSSSSTSSSSKQRFTTVMILLVNAGLFVATVIYSMRGGNENAIMGIDRRTLVYFGASLRRRFYWASGGVWSPPAFCMAAFFISS